MRIHLPHLHMPHVHMPHIEDHRIKAFGRSIVALGVVMLIMLAFAAVFLRETPAPQADWLLR